MGGGRVGKVSKANKRKLGGGRGENKVAKKKNTEIRAEKGQTRNVKLRWHRDRKRGSCQCTFHPRWCTGSLWPYKTTFFFLSFLHMARRRRRS